MLKHEEHEGHEELNDGWIVASSSIATNPDPMRLSFVFFVPFVFHS
jgi:hypothetical protein